MTISTTLQLDVTRHRPPSGRTVDWTGRSNVTIDLAVSGLTTVSPRGLWQVRFDVLGRDATDQHLFSFQWATLVPAAPPDLWRIDLIDSWVIAARDPRTHRVHQSMTVRDSILDEDPPSRPFRYGDLRLKLPAKDSVFARATFTPLTRTSAKIAPVESNTVEAFFELAPLPVR